MGNQNPRDEVAKRQRIAEQGGEDFARVNRGYDERFAQGIRMAQTRNTGDSEPNPDYVEEYEPGDDLVRWDDALNFYEHHPIIQSLSGEVFNWGKRNWPRAYDAENVEDIMIAMQLWHRIWNLYHTHLGYGHDLVEDCFWGFRRAYGPIVNDHVRQRGHIRRYMAMARTEVIRLPCEYLPKYIHFVQRHIWIQLGFNNYNPLMTPIDGHVRDWLADVATVQRMKGVLAEPAEELEVLG